MIQYKKIEKAVFAMGCFWCYEAIFSILKGIATVFPGYTGGQMKNPTYNDVCKGNTGHAECIYLEYDSSKISYNELLEIFWNFHDPTTLNRQGNDVGTQYRSEIFYYNDTQKNLAQESLSQEQKKYNVPIVTKISPINTFYVAEDYHKNYFKNNPNNLYCQITILPKIKKLQEKYLKML